MRTVGKIARPRAHANSRAKSLEDSTLKSAGERLKVWLLGVLHSRARV